METRLENQIYAALAYKKIKAIRDEISVTINHPIFVRELDEHLQNAQDGIYTFLIEQGYPVNVLED